MLFFLALVLLASPVSYAHNAFTGGGGDLSRVAQPFPYPGNVADWASGQTADASVLVWGDGAPGLQHVLDALRVPYSVGTNMGPARVVIVDGALADGDIPRLRLFAQRGGQIIFMALPQDIPPDLACLLGVAALGERVAAQALHIYEGIFPFGAFVSNAFPFEVQAVALDPRTKVYAQGFTAEARAVPVIWRRSLPHGAVYVVNAPFLERSKAMGILAGLLALALDDFIYPIVGTHTVLLLGFPFAVQDEMAYGRTVLGFARDIVWPTLARHAQVFGLVYAAFAGDTALPAAEAHFFSHALHIMRGGTLHLYPAPHTAFPDFFQNPEAARFALHSQAAAAGWVFLPLDMAPLSVYAEWHAAAQGLHGLFAEAAFPALEAANFYQAAQAMENYLQVVFRVDYAPEYVAVAMDSHHAPVAFLFRTRRAVNIPAAESVDIQRIAPGVYVVRAAGSFVLPLQERGCP